MNAQLLLTHLRWIRIQKRDVNEGRGRRKSLAASSSITLGFDRCVFSYLKQTYPLLITLIQMHKIFTHTRTHTCMHEVALINNTQSPNEFQLIPAM